MECYIGLHNLYLLLQSLAPGSTAFSHNTGLSSARGSQTGVIVSREADLVTAHG